MTEYRKPLGSMQGELDALYARLDPLFLDPGFRITDVSIWKEPKKGLEPAIWRWAEGKAALSMCYLCFKRACATVTAVSKCFFVDYS